MKREIIGKQFSKKVIVHIDCKAEQEAFREYMEKLSDRVREHGLWPLNFEARLKHFKEVAKNILRESGLPDAPVVFFQESKPDEWQIQKPDAKEFLEYPLEKYVSEIIGCEIDGPEHLAAQILEKIDIIGTGEDPEKKLDDAFFLGRLVALAHVYGVLSDRGHKHGIKSKESREKKISPHHSYIIKEAKRMIAAGWKPRDLAAILADRTDINLSQRQIRTVLRRNGL